MQVGSRHRTREELEAHHAKFLALHSSPSRQKVRTPRSSNTLEQTCKLSPIHSRFPSLASCGMILTRDSAFAPRQFIYEFGREAAERAAVYPFPPLAPMKASGTSQIGSPKQTPSSGRWKETTTQTMFQNDFDSRPALMMPETKHRILKAPMCSAAGGSNDSCTQARHPTSPHDALCVDYVLTPQPLLCERCRHDHTEATFLMWNIHGKAGNV